MLHFVTLFDYNYIDRGLALYESLNKVCDEFILYIIPFDEKCYEALVECNLIHTHIIKFNDFEDDTLRAAKNNRNRKEFLWTCSSFSIRYILNKFKVFECTYLDSDLYFYSTPVVCINKFLESDNDAAIISHRYSNHIENKWFERVCGKYCVEFNTFKNTARGIQILDWWCERCLEMCPDKPTPYAFGDQKYLDNFSELFDGVYVYDDFGLGIAPWNVDDYIFLYDGVIKNKVNNISGKIIFYHFHSISYGDECANINVYKRPGKKDKRLIDYLYKPYLSKIKKYSSKYPKPMKYVSLIERIIGALGYIIEEKNIYISIRKMFRFIFFRRNDIYKYI